MILPDLIVVVIWRPLSNVFPILNDVPWEIQPSSISNHYWSWKNLIASGYISYMIILQNQLVDDPALIVVAVRCPLSNGFPILNDVP